MRGSLLHDGTGGAHGQGGVSLYNGIAQSIGSCDNTLGSNPRATPIIVGGQVVFTCANGGANSAGTLVSMPRIAHAQGAVIGQGCGAGFTPVLTAPGVPKLGQTLTVALSGAPPFTPGGYVYSGIPSTATEISPGCTVYVDLATFAEFGTLFTTPFGAHSLTYPLPPLPECSGALVPCPGLRGHADALAGLRAQQRTRAHAGVLTPHRRRRVRPDPADAPELSAGPHSP